MAVYKLQDKGYTVSIRQEAHAMATHIFTLERWFMNSDEDWDCDCEYLVVRDGAVETREHGSGATFFCNRLRAEFPDAVWHDEDLSLHRDKLEPRGLEGLDERLLAALRGHFAFKDEPRAAAV